VRRILQEDGFRAFYASYPTTVLMNVPFMAGTIAGAVIGASLMV